MRWLCVTGPNESLAIVPRRDSVEPALYEIEVYGLYNKYIIQMCRSLRPCAPLYAIRINVCSL
jgi:hypothetical protein